MAQFNAQAFTAAAQGMGYSPEEIAGIVAMKQAQSSSPESQMKDIQLKQASLNLMQDQRKFQQDTNPRPLALGTTSAVSRVAPAAIAPVTAPTASPAATPVVNHEQQVKESLAEQIGKGALNLFIPGITKAVSAPFNPNSPLNKEAKSGKGNLPQSIANAVQRTGEFAGLTVPAGIEAGSFAVPFGKAGFAGSKFIAPGALSATMAGIGRGDKPQALVGDALLGGATAGAMQLIGKGVSKLASGVTDKLPKRIMDTIYKEPVKGTKAAISKGTDLGEEVLKRPGGVGTTEGLFTNATNQIDDAENALQATLSGSKGTVDIKDITKAAKPLIDQYTQSGNLSAAKSITDRLVAIQEANGSKIPVAAANEVKRALYSEAAKAYGTEAGANMEGTKAIARGLKESIEKAAPEVGQINKDLSFWGRVRDSLLDKLTKDQRNNLIGLTDLPFAAGSFIPGAQLPAIAGYGVKKAAGSTIGKTAIAKGLSNLGNVAVPDIIKNAATQVAGQTAARLPSIAEQGQNQATQNENQPILQNNGSVTQQPIGAQAPVPQQTVSGYTPEQLRKAYSNALVAGDTTGAEQIKKLVDNEEAYQKAQTSKAPQSNAALGVVDELQRLYGDVEKEGLTAPGPGLGPVIGNIKGNIAATTQFSPNAAQYRDQREAFISLIVRGLGEKGTLNEGDIKRVTAAIPTFSDTPTTAAQKWKTVRSILNKAASKEAAVPIDTGAYLPAIQ